MKMIVWMYILKNNIKFWNENDSLNIYIKE